MVRELFHACAPWNSLFNQSLFTPDERLFFNKSTIIRLARAKMIDAVAGAWRKGVPWSYEPYMDHEILSLAIRATEAESLSVAQLFTSNSTWSNSTRGYTQHDISNGFFKQVVNQMMEPATRSVFGVNSTNGNGRSIRNWAMRILYDPKDPDEGQLWYGEPWFVLYQAMLVSDVDMAWDLVQHGYTMDGVDSKWFIISCFNWAEQLGHEPLQRFFSDALSTYKRVM
jgi:hypothetical protein